MRKALLVGINDYDWPGGKLKGCANDAIALASALNRNFDGSPNFTCKVMVADQEDEHQEAQNKFPGLFVNTTIKRTNLRRSIEELFSGECDMALFFFSGHGHEDNLGGALVTADARKYDEGVSITDLLQIAHNATQIKEIFLILDCCHSGQLGNMPSVNQNTAMLRQGLSILTASMADEVAREQQGQGMFTRVLLEGLNGGAADVTGKVTAASLYNFADNALGAFDQRPVFKSHVTSMKRLRKAAPQVPDEYMHMIPTFFQGKDDKFALDKSFEATEEPANAENEKKFGILQNYRAAGLVKPSTQDHLYYEALNEGSCELTPLGKLYWKMVLNNKI